MVLLYVDQANLSTRLRGLVRHTVLAALLLPAGFFLSMLTPDATEPNRLIYLAYLSAASLTVGLLTLGVGLVRRPLPDMRTPAPSGKR